jgi:6-phosphogluconolactonase
MTSPLPGASRTDVYLTASPEAQAARLLAAAIVEADARRGFARLAIAGGSALRALGAAREALPAAVWARVRLTWVDERCVPFASADSNRGEAHRSGALEAASPPAVELALFEDGEVPDAARARAEAALRDAFAEDGVAGLDVTLLGMGPDGHIASLFPGDAPFAEPAGALVRHVPDSPKPPPSRLTLSRALLATARVHVLLAVGEGKREALERLLLEDPRLPAVGLDGLAIVTDVDLSNGKG